MTKIITVHGLNFVVEGHGFVKYNAELDFAIGVEVIEAALALALPTEVKAMHAAGIDWVSRNCEGDRPAAFDDFERVGLEAATAGWHDPSKVIISLSAID